MRRCKGGKTTPGARESVEGGPRCLLIDLDDTLFDHVGSIRRALGQFRKGYPALGRQSKTELLARHTLHLTEIHPRVLSGEMTIDASRVERMRRLFEGVGERPGHRELVRRSAELRALYQASRGPVPGALSFLKFAHRRSRVVIVSNNLLQEQREKLALLGLSPYVDDLVTSEELGLVKPDPAMFVAALERNAIHRRDAVTLGDSFESDIVGSMRAEIPVVWLNRFEARPPPGAPPIPTISTLTPPSRAWSAVETAWRQSRRGRTVRRR